MQGHGVKNGIRRRRLASDVADGIVRLMRSKGYRAGDQLPTVSTLAEDFSVASHTIREALNQLEVLGVINIRHGSGIYVADDAGRLVHVNPFHDGTGLQRAADLLQTRLYLEPPLAALAAEHITEMQLAGIRTLLDRASHVLDGSAKSNQSLNELNLAFHGAVAEASGNTVGRDLVNVLSKLYAAEQLALLPLCEAWIDQYHLHDHRSHEEILEALTSGSADMAERLMQGHIEAVLKIVQAAIAKDSGSGGAESPPSKGGGVPVRAEEV